MTYQGIALGRWGEQVAADHLLAAGYEIVTRNYRCPFAEVDIIAKEGGDLVFIEVKTRRTNRFGHPAEAVTRRKQEKLVQAALHYLDANASYETNCRFDVVAITPAPGVPAKVEIFRHAFIPESEQSV